MLLLATSIVFASLESDFHALKATMHTLSESEINTRLNALRVRSLAAPPRVQQSKIDHFVVLLMENHAADSMFGCMNLPGFDGIPSGGLQLPIDAKDPSKGNVTVTCGTADYVCKAGPGFDMYNTLWANGSNHETYPYDEQSIANAYANGAQPGVTINMFSPEQLPVKANIASEFGVFNRLFTAVPSASEPNHLFIQSATSCGATSNYFWNRCGGSQKQYPQMTIYDSMFISNVSFGLYLNASCGIDGHPPCAGREQGTPSIDTPDVSMAGVARHADRFFSQTLFYEAAEKGTLPAFSWLMPPVQACDHPCHDVAKGERYVKDVYEALRAGPKWNRTLFFVVYDDGGGFFDHVPAPVGIPADKAPCHIEPSPCSKFDFRRTGERAAAYMMSPWVGKGAVFQRPKMGNFNTSEFEETSVPATIKSLFNLTGYLTKRDEWAASFEELLLETPRTDTPMHLPTPPNATGGWTPAPPLTDDSAGPQHCAMSTGKCLGAAAMTAKQRRQLELFSFLTQTPSPDTAAMSNHEAQVYIRARWGEWIAAQHANAL